MAELQYSNPFSLVPNPQVLKPQNSLPTADQGGLALAEAERQSVLAQPFIEMARQAQQMALTKDATELGEFVDPESANIRRRQRQAQGAEADYKIGTLPGKTRYEAAEYDAKLKNLPYLSDAEREKAIRAAREDKAAPYAAFYEDMAAAHEAFSKLPEAARPFAWQQFVQQWEAKNPGVKVPDQFREWNPGTAKFLSWNSAMHIGTVKHRQEMEKQTSINEKDIKVANIKAKAETDAARIRAETPKESGSAAALRSKATEILSNPNSTDQEVEKAARYLASERRKDNTAAARKQVENDQLWNMTNLDDPTKQRDKSYKQYLDEWEQSDIEDFKRNWAALREFSGGGSATPTPATPKAAPAAPPVKQTGKAPARIRYDAQGNRMTNAQ